MISEASPLIGLEYHGISGSSNDCQDAVLRLIQFGWNITKARIVSWGNNHCFLLTNSIYDQIAIKSGFTTGYDGTGPYCFSYTLQILDSHGVEIDECEVDERFIERLDLSALTVSDIEIINSAKPIRPSRWSDYVTEKHFQEAQDGKLWSRVSPVIPFSIIDPRIMDLALKFWTNADHNLMTGYRRLEDIIRDRTGLHESNTKLFARAFADQDSILTWNLKDKGEKTGRANLFTGTYMAYRNPRAHHETPNTELLLEFLQLNQLYRLEHEAVKV